MRAAVLAMLACGCLGPRVDDVPAAMPDAGTVSALLPPGTVVPSIADDAELSSQIQIFDGLNDNALAMTGMVTRSAGKANGASVMYWNFGPAAIVDGIAIAAPLYVLCEPGSGATCIERTDHPYLIDSIPGDSRYSAIRRVIFVHVTSTYAGELVTTVAALDEAIARGLVDEPVPAGIWRNMPVVPTGTKLELGGSAPPAPAREVFGLGHRIELFELGGTLGAQPFRNNLVPIRDRAVLFSGVPSGMPPTLSTAPDAQPVFQLGIPGGPPGMAFNYTPIVSDVDVRLADGVAPSSITSDADLFVRASNGSISAYYTDTVASYTTTTTVSNHQIQFAEGSP